MFGLARYSSHNTGAGVGNWTNWFYQWAFCATAATSEPAARQLVSGFIKEGGAIEGQERSAGWYWAAASVGTGQATMAGDGDCSIGITQDPPRPSIRRP